MCQQYFQRGTAKFSSFHPVFKFFLNLLFLSTVVFYAGILLFVLL
jgi:hypothetical protein